MGFGFALLDGVVALGDVVVVLGTARHGFDWSDWLVRISVVFVDGVIVSHTCSMYRGMYGYNLSRMDLF